MQFKDIIGQKTLKEKLVLAADSGRISHAQLFLGADGFGGLALALAYMQYISCENKTKQDSCGVCSSCKKMNGFIHPDVHFVFPVNTSDLVKTKAVSDDFLPQWRALLSDRPYFGLSEWYHQIGTDQKQGIIGVNETQKIFKKLAYKPYESSYNFLLIWHADKINTEASNKLLKLIEEPNKQTLLLLLAEKEEDMLQTIRSRTQITVIPPIEEKALEDQLDANSTIALDQKKKLLQLSQGNWLKAMHYLSESEEQETYFILFKEWMRACYKANILEMNKWVENICSKNYGRESHKKFIQYAMHILREGLMESYGNEEIQFTTKEESIFTKNFAPYVHANNIFPMCEILNDAEYHIGRNAYAKILFMDLSMKFANLLHVKNVHL